MEDWTHGYVTDVNYNYKYYAELNPTLLSFIVLEKGFLPPSLEEFTYCELGFGQGFTTNILAAANPQAQFWATDFNPTQALEAKRLASLGNLPNMHFCDRSFAEFLEMPTPEFDFIVLNGVYSWISPANQEIIVEILRRKLKLGGIVYISYNALPGLSSIIPLRDLMLQFTQQSNGSTLTKIEQAIVFTEQVKQLNSQFFQSNTSATLKLEQIKRSDRHYLAHEYFNRDWHAFYHAQIRSVLAQAKLTYVASANLTQELETLGLDKEQNEFLESLCDPTLQETTKDFFFNRIFRQDIFIKGAVNLTEAERLQRLGQLKFALMVLPEQIKPNFPFVGGTVQMASETYQPLVEHLHSKPQTLEQLSSQILSEPVRVAEFCQMLKIMIVKGYIQPALNLPTPEQTKQLTTQFNRAVINQVALGYKLEALASPILGSGLIISRCEQLFILALQKELELLPFTYSVLESLGVKLTSRGQLLESPEATKAELHRREQWFYSSRLPILKNLGIV